MGEIQQNIETATEIARDLQSKVESSGLIETLAEGGMDVAVEVGFDFVADLIGEVLDS